MVVGSIAVVGAVVEELIAVCSRADLLSLHSMVGVV